MDPSRTVSIHPYFEVYEGKLEEFKALLPSFIEKTKSEEACLFYDFTINGNVVFCRESYIGAEGVLAHLENVGGLLDQALGISELNRIEFHGAAAQLDKLREPLKDLNPDWFVFESGLEK